MTVDILKQTKIGQTVNIAKKKFVESEKVVKLARDLVASWKSIYETDKTKVPHPKSSVADSNQGVHETRVVNKEPNGQSSCEANDTVSAEELMHINSLPDGRRKVRLERVLLLF